MKSFNFSTLVVTKVFSPSVESEICPVNDKRYGYMPLNIPWFLQISLGSKTELPALSCSEPTYQLADQHNSHLPSIKRVLELVDEVI